LIGAHIDDNNNNCSSKLKKDDVRERTRRAVPKNDAEKVLIA